MSLGALRAGFHLSLAVELDAHAMTAHTCNFPGFRHRADDISTLNGTTLLERACLETGGLSGLIGGPPCQGFSVMGRRDVVDPRNNLFVKFYQLVAECRPKFFVAENVLGIMHAQYDEIRRTANRLVEEEYVLVEPIVIKASDYGAPTSRTRVFFIGYRADAVRPITHEDLEARRAPGVRVAEALRGLPVAIEQDWLTEERSWRSVLQQPPSRFWERVEGAIPAGMGDPEALRRLQQEFSVSGCFGTRHSDQVAARYHALGHGKQDATSKAIRLDPLGFCPTLRAGTDNTKGSRQAVRPIHPVEPRVITPREAARLQGFPDWFRFAPSKWHSFRQIGNSVSPIVAEAVFDVMMERLCPAQEVVTT